jgi:hypothetical protein
MRDINTSRDGEYNYTRTVNGNITKYPTTYKEAMRYTSVVQTQSFGDKTRVHPLIYRTSRVNNYEGSEWRKVSSIEERSYTGILSSYSGNTNSVPGYLADMAYNQALSRFNSKVRDSDLNAAVSVAEAPETIEMLASTYKAAKTTKKFLLKALRNPVDSVTSAWLSYKYGWLPTYLDLYAAMEFKLKKSDELKARGRATMRSEEVATSTAYGYLTTTRERYTARHEIGGTLRASAAYNLSRATSLNPASVAWELVPLSFVADWFIDVGGYLADFETAIGQGLEWVDGWSTLSQEVYTTVQREYVGSSSNLKHSSAASAVNRYVNRSILHSHPFPRLPRFQVDLGSHQMLSAGALFWQLIVKKFTRSR